MPKHAHKVGTDDVIDDAIGLTENGEEFVEM